MLLIEEQNKPAFRLPGMPFCLGCLSLRAGAAQAPGGRSMQRLVDGLGQGAGDAFQVRLQGSGEELVEAVVGGSRGLDRNG